MSDRLKEDILQYLAQKLNIKPESIRVQLSILKRDHSGLTLNAAAQVYARKHGTSILPKLTEKDKEALAHVRLTMIPERKVGIPTSSPKPTPKTFIFYETGDKFELKHIEEINRAYNAGCYTATYILCRKVIENLIIDLLRKVFPTQPDLYFDISKKRFRDFSEVLKNLLTNKSHFPISVHKAIDRLYHQSLAFKDEANDKTHSLFHIATKKELADANIDEILDLILAIDKAI